MQHNGKIFFLGLTKLKVCFRINSGIWFSKQMISFFNVPSFFPNSFASRIGMNPSARMVRKSYFGPYWVHLFGKSLPF
jgi:hypothetical protein